MNWFGRSVRSYLTHWQFLPWQRMLALIGAFLLMMGMILPFFSSVYTVEGNSIGSRSIFALDGYQWGGMVFNSRLIVNFSLLLMLFAWLRPHFRLGYALTLPLFLYAFLGLAAAFNWNTAHVGAHAYMTGLLLIGIALYGRPAGTSS